MNEVTIEVLWGIPGVGKTHYARQFSDKRVCRSAVVIDCDSILKHNLEYKLHSNSTDAVADDIVWKTHYYSRIITDGLITKNSQANELFEAITTHPSLDKNYKLTFEVTWWPADRETCLHNDRGRRSVDSSITIENIVFEEPSAELIRQWNLKATKKEVVKKPDWKVWSQEAGIIGPFEEKLESKSWCLGGTSGNCWNDDKDMINSTPRPEFVELEQLLEKICPDLSFINYRKIYNATVTVENDYHCDYYGGEVGYACYVCDLAKLYEMLNELKLIQGG